VQDAGFKRFSHSQKVVNSECNCYADITEESCPKKGGNYRDWGFYDSSPQETDGGNSLFLVQPDNTDKKSF
jgi:hypothetical protein